MAGDRHMFPRRAPHRPRGLSTPSAGASACADIERGANLILRKFEAYLDEFLVITRRAGRSFEQRDWRDASERLGLYEKALAQISIQLEAVYRGTVRDRRVWSRTRELFSRLAAGPYDFFLDEIGTFLGIPDPLRGTFRTVHRDPFTLEYWRSVKSRVVDGEIIDIIPYDRSKRFRRSGREA